MQSLAISDCKRVSLCAQSRIKALERMQEVKVMEEDPECAPTLHPAKNRTEEEARSALKKYLLSPYNWLLLRELLPVTVVDLSGSRHNNRLRVSFPFPNMQVRLPLPGPGPARAAAHRVQRRDVQLPGEQQGHL